MKAFSRWARDEGISDETLLSEIEKADQGNTDASLGNDVYKIRIARQGQGSSGGYRTIVGLKRGDKAFYLHGWDKKQDYPNINKNFEKSLKALADVYFAMDDISLSRAIEAGVLREIGTPEGGERKKNAS